MPPRFGQPPGFGGAYTDPLRGEFQPGIEQGVVDPNANKFWAAATTISFTTTRPATGTISDLAPGTVASFATRGGTNGGLNPNG